MTEMNLDSNDIVGSLEEFESLETIQAQLDILNDEGQENKVQIITEMMPDLMPKEEVEVKREEIIERMEEDELNEMEEEEEVEEEEEEEEEIDDAITANMMEDTMSNEMIQMQNVIEEMQTETVENVIRHDNHSLFSEGVIEEVIEDEQVIREDRDPRIYDEVEQIAQEQILEEKDHDFMENMIDDNVITEETVIESGQVEDKTQIDPLQIKDEIRQEIVEQQQPNVVTSGVYVFNTSGTQIATESILQGSTLIAPKDTATKMARVVTIPNTVETSSSSGQTIRIVAPQGKVLGGMGKTFTLEQARRMGLISQANINQILPANAKTVTVVKSPTKILPAPPPQHKGQKLLIRNAGALKPGTILTASSPGGHVIRIPTNQTITTHLQLPGSTKQVQYVKLIGGSKTLLPVSLPKTIPVALTPSFNSQTTYKVVPISAAQQASVGNATAQRVIVATSTAASPMTSTPQPTPVVHNSSLVVLPTNLLQQVKKDQILPTVATIRAATTNGRRASNPTAKIKESTSPIPPIAIPTSQAQQPQQQQQPAQVQNSNSLSPTSVNLSPNLTMTSKEVKSDYWSEDETIVGANGIRPRKPCNCTKSMCLKLYCDCFANGEFCNMCNCTCCYNNLDHEEERQLAIKSCLERNPTAFRPKIGKTFTGSEERRHNKGCNCRRSGCLKNYCECYEAKIPCSKNCKCFGCKNTELFIGKRGPNSDDRIRMKNDATSIKLQYDQHSAGQRQAFNLMTNQVVQATCQCLIAQAEEWEKQYPINEIDKVQSVIIEEFGRCVVQIIDCVAKSITQQPPLPSTS